MPFSRRIQSLLKRLAYRCGFSLRRLRGAKRIDVAGGDDDRSIRTLLHRVDPYKNFDWRSHPDDGSHEEEDVYQDLVAW